MEEIRTDPEVETPGREAIAFNGVDTPTDKPTYIGENCIITTGTITLESLRIAGIDADKLKFEAL